MKNFVICTGGQIPSWNSIEAILAQADILIASDSGMDYLVAHQCYPQYWIGDMDSTKSLIKDDLKYYSDQKKVKIIPLEKEKTDTDTEQALKLAYDLYEKENKRKIHAPHACPWPITLIGGGGGELEHQLALMDMYHCYFPQIWYTHANIIRWLDSDTVLSMDIGQSCSFFPVGSGPWAIYSEGLKWNLKFLQYSHPNQLRYSLHNIAEQNQVYIHIQKGNFISVENLQ